MSFKKDEELGGMAFYHDKAIVIQEARVFNESPISPRKCRALLTRIVFLLYVGETFTTQEATTLFFGVTKLFQHKDVSPESLRILEMDPLTVLVSPTFSQSSLRQMVYLVIKELSSVAEDVIMVTSSIMKDMQPNLEVIYRPNAIRALARIIDASSVVSVERFFKSAIVDKNPSISSAAMVSAYHLHPVAKDVIRRWANETQEAANGKAGSAGGLYGAASNYFGSGTSAQQPGYQAIPSTSYIMQYHALGLLYLIREKDRMAVTKMIQQFGGSGKGSSGVLKNPMALVMLIRYASKVMEEDPNVYKQMYEFLDGLLRHKSDMVNIEAARALTEVKIIDQATLYRPVAVLQLFLSSPKPVLKFAAIRSLNKLAQSHPGAVAGCNLDIENLITDSNRSIATYAITTLLKTGNEASVDRLMKQISGFMTEITDEFKIIVVDAIRSLCLKFPTKQAVMLSFLSGVLRDEGGYDFKRAVVDAIFDMIKYIGECKEAALAHLCEFIEDCEFTKLSVQILHLLGLEGPKTKQPTKFIRYIYNRVVLENAVVRAAAVSSLAKFGVSVEDPTITKSVNVLLRRCLDDVDDEVRDRAAMYLKALEDESLADTYIRNDSSFPLANLESALMSYLKTPEQQEQAFDTSSIPKISREQAAAAVPRQAPLDIASSSPLPQIDSAQPSSADAIQSLYTAQLEAVPELQTYGPVLRSSTKPIALTESETEYVVTAVKHIYKEHIVFQFNITNTLPDTVLENVSVIMTPSEDTPLTEDFIIPYPALTSDVPGVVYVSFTRNDPAEYAIGAFGCTLKFVSKEVDPTSGEPEEEGYDDEYQVEELDLGAGDYISPNYVTFSSEWERLKGGATSTETFALSSSESLKAACESLIEVLNMDPLGGTEHPASTSVHTLNLSGILCGGGGKVLARCRMTFQSGAGVTLELGVPYLVTAPFDNQSLLPKERRRRIYYGSPAAELPAELAGDSSEMERTWSNNSGAALSASSSSGAAEETTSLATTIPGSTSRLLDNPVVESPLSSAAPVSASTARRRYSWNVDEEEQITPKGTRQRIPALDLSTSVRNRHSQARASSSAKVNIEAGLFTDVILSPVEVKHHVHPNPFPAPKGGPGGSQHSIQSDSNGTVKDFLASHGSASDSQQTDSEGEYHELDSLPLQSRHHNEIRLPAFESSSTPNGMRKSQSSSRRTRYPSIRTTGLGMREDGALSSRRRSLQDRAGDLVRQMSKRVVNINADEDEEESMPFNTIEEGDVQSESDSDSLEVVEETSQLASLDSDANGRAAITRQDNSSTQRATPEPQIQRPPVGSFSIGVVQEPPQVDLISPQTPSNEGKTLGLFGPDSRIRKACNTLIRNRYVFLWVIHAHI
ncbi:hypothetical protein QFC22_001856 [Naganishia vaughanmartiniae]|uniref:Uncharacterized protein n=1 Tax=Naganishia vaughanmartiniae TaxID=1424756 RepID=A0ACC2XGB4_9TREE|nr:hypothetical protein QFC22_001856 [Naganishia vaughanmartiniae]